MIIYVTLRHIYAVPLKFEFLFGFCYYYIFSLFKILFHKTPQPLRRSIVSYAAPNKVTLVIKNKQTLVITNVPVANDIFVN